MARNKDSAPCDRTLRLSRRKWGLSCIAAFAFERLASYVPANNLSTDETQTAIRKGIGYIIRQQSEDGAWKSSRYRVLQHNGELTAFITCVLSRHCLDYSGVREVVSKAIGYLQNLDFTKTQLSYPVYTFSFLSAISTQNCIERLSFQPADYLLNTLEKYRYGTENGWTKKDLHFGGWGYDASYPKKNSGEQAYFRGPNMSATLFGLMAYRNLGVTIDDNRINQIYQFVCRCQNIQNVSDMPTGDGGFFFSPTDTLRNKAGYIENKLPRKIFPSYGSATADGLRALKLCGLNENNPRVYAARRWLLNNVSKNKHPGLFVDERESIRDAYTYYYSWSLASVLRDLDDSAGQLIVQLNKDLLVRQSSNGSWKNALLDGKEDDPLVATPMAISSLVLLSS